MDERTYEKILDSGIRAKEAALSLLESDFKRRIPDEKQTSLIIKNLCNCLLDEVEKFRDNKKAPSLARVKKYLEVLKFVISRTKDLLKNKLRLSLIRDLTLLFRGDNKDGLAAAFDANIPSILQTIIPKTRLTKQDWIRLVDDISNHLTRTFPVTIDSKAVTSLLRSLRFLLVDHVTYFAQVKGSTTKMILSYLSRGTTHANSSMSHLIDIANTVLICLLTTDAQSGLKICQLMLQLSTNSFSSNYEDLKRQTLVFFNIVPEYFRNDLYFMMKHIPDSEDEEEKAAELVSKLAADCKSALVESIKTYSKSLSTTNIAKNSIALKIDDIEACSLSAGSDGKSWCDFGSFRLRDGKADFKWMHLVSIVKLVDLYYYLSGKVTRDYVAKRSRTERMSIESILQGCDTAAGFLQALLVTDDHRLLALQLTLFYVASFPLDYESFKIQWCLLELYPVKSLKPWISILLKTMMSLGFPFDSALLSQILRINIQMIKEHHNFKMACSTVIQVINMPHFEELSTEKSVIELITSIHETPVNSPHEIANESIELWVAISKYCTSSHVTFSDKMIEWLLSKISKLDIRQCAALVPFVHWLFGSPYTRLTAHKKLNSGFMKSNVDLNHSIGLGRVILATEIPSPPTVVHTVVFDSTAAPISEVAVSRFVVALDDTLNQSEAGELHQLLTMVSFSFAVLQHSISLLGQTSSQVESLKFAITRLLTGLSCNSQQDKNTWITSLMSFQIINNFGLFIKDLISPSEILSGIDEDSTVSSFRQQTPDDDFEMGPVRTTEATHAFHESHQTLTYTDLSERDLITGSAIDFLMVYHSDFGFSFGIKSMTNEALDYLEKVSSRGFIVGFHKLLQFFIDNEIDNMGSKNLEASISMLGSRLGREKELPDLLRTVISEFLNHFFKRLFLNGDKILRSHSMDLTNYLLANVGYDISEIKASVSLFVKITEVCEIWPDHLKDLTQPVLGVVKSSGALVMDVCSDNMISGYVQELEYSKQLEFFENFKRCFEGFENSYELSACYSLFLLRISRTSFGMLVGICVELLKNSTVSTFVEYYEDVFKKVIAAIEGTDRYDFCLLELFSYWCGANKSFEDFPVSILGFKSVPELISRCQRLLYPMIRSKKTNGGAIPLGIKPYFSKSRDLERDTLSLHLSLALTKDGNKAEAIKQLSSMPSYALRLQLGFLVLSILNLLDFSEEYESMTSIPFLKSSKYFTQLFIPDCPVIQHNVNLSISIADGTHHILSVLKRTKGWTEGSVNFILLNLLNQLSQSTNDVKYQLIVLRRIKLLFIIAHSAFVNLDNVKLCLRFLAPSITNSQLRRDACKLLELILKDHVNQDDLMNELFPCEILPVFKLVIEVISQGSGLFDEGLTMVLYQIYELVPTSNPFRDGFGVLYQFLKLRDNDNYESSIPDALKICDILCQLSRALKSAASTAATVIELATFLLNFCIRSNVSSNLLLSYNFPISQATESLLLEILHNKSQLSEPVKCFIGRYLGTYYSQGNLLERKSGEFAGDALDLLQDDEDSTLKANGSELSVLFSKLLTYRNSPKTTNIGQILGIGYILGYAAGFSPTQLNDLNIKEIIFTHGCDVLTLDELSLSIVGFNGSGVIPLGSQSQNQSQSFSAASSSVISIDDFILTCSNLPYEQWLHLLSLSLADSLVDRFPILKPLVRFLQRYESIPNLNIVNELWVFYIRNAGKNDRTFMKFMDSICSMSKPELLEFGPEKAKVVLSMVQIVRVLALDERKLFPDIYARFKLDKLHQMANMVHLDKFALILFEDHCHRSANNQPLFDESRGLLAIYEGINDSDLFSGVPIEPSLDFAMDALMKNGVSSNDVMSVMFNGARVEASKMLNKKYSMAPLSRSLKQNNFNVISSMLSTSTDTFTPGGSDSYDWSWKLNSWDLPEPSVPQSGSETIYKLLRNVHIGKSPTEIVDLCTGLYGSLTDQMGSKSLSDVSISLAAIVCCERLTSSDLDLKLDITHHDALVCKLVNDGISTDSIETIVRMRRSLYPMLSNSVADSVKISRTDVACSVSYESLILGKLAKLNSDSQSSINNAVFLNEFVKTLKTDPMVDESVGSLISRLSSFNSASMLWDQGQIRPPISMLQQNLNFGNLPMDIGKDSHYTDFKFPLSLITLPDSFLQGHLIKWTSTSREKKPEEIMRFVDSTLPTIDDIESSEKKSQIYLMIGSFCYEQVKKTNLEQDITTVRSKILSIDNDITDLESALERAKYSRDERNANWLQKTLRNMKVTRSIEKDRYDGLVRSQKSCIEKAVSCFLSSISLHDSNDFEIIDKLFAFWFEYSDNRQVNGSITHSFRSIPFHKFIPWMAQLTSRLASSTDGFQKVLKALILEITIRHPYHSIYHIINVNSYKDYREIDTMTISRAEAAEGILNQLAKKKALGSKDRNVVDSVLRLCESIKDFASLRQDNVTQYDLRKLRHDTAGGGFWLQELPKLMIPLPTMNHIPVSLASDYSTLSWVQSVDPIVKVAPTGLSKPKIMKFTLSDGTVHKAVLKGSTDDLRQDAIMIQVLDKVSMMLKIDKHTRRRNMRLRTYKVVPLGSQSGIIEFVSNSIALRDAVVPLHQKDPVTNREALKLMSSVISLSKEIRISEYTKLTKKIKPKFRDFFIDNFPNVDDWFQSRQIYTRGLAATSFVGYILGIGDRHLNNILLEEKTCEPIHIDFGVAFDQGRLLPIPELVPFRLTRDMVDGLGVTGVKGSFEKCSVHTYRVLRENSEKILGILRVLEFDPLHRWVISSLRKQKILGSSQLDGPDINSGVGDDGVKPDSNITAKSPNSGNASDAVNAIKACEYKLIGNGLSVEATVQEQIQEATDTERLALIFQGWSPFY
ncbi:hypothetical protein WICPIJ_005999 [Wickerhamomyces pijperi]|uniref:Serine/threonine-protein kinase TEL1 n=1 Tax=Wickerhamomyces pijperi TaxID=599730 RepID=A0A9P8TLF3_WICPI|nr:hypothetical protein WICPIJ_005999 [Wickerhamomyces pijperi]